MGIETTSSIVPGPGHVAGICVDCSAEAVWRCGHCLYRGCLNHSIAKHKCPVESGEEVRCPRRQLANRGDFAVDKAVVGARGERRYWLCGPDAANEHGITLENLKAVWHLIGDVLEGEA